jgi:hypothetical protein
MSAGRSAARFSRFVLSRDGKRAAAREAATAGQVREAGPDASRQIEPLVRH